MARSGCPMCYCPDEIGCDHDEADWIAWEMSRPVPPPEVCSDCGVATNTPVGCACPGEPDPCYECERLDCPKSLWYHRNPLTCDPNKPRMTTAELDAAYARSMDCAAHLPERTFTWRQILLINITAVLAAHGSYFDGLQDAP